MSVDEKKLEAGQTLSAELLRSIWEEVKQLKQKLQVLESHRRVPAPPVLFGKAVNTIPAATVDSVGNLIPGKGDFIVWAKDVNDGKWKVTGRKLIGICNLSGDPAPGLNAGSSSSISSGSHSAGSSSSSSHSHSGSSHSSGNGDGLPIVGIIYDQQSSAYVPFYQACGMPYQMGSGSSSSSD